MRLGTLSLRSRLLAGMALVAAVLVAVSVLLTATTRSQLIAQIDDRLVSFSPIRDGDVDHLPFPGDGGFTDLGDGAPPPALPDRTDRGRISDAHQGYFDGDGVLEDVFTPNFGDVEYSAPALGIDDVPDSRQAISTTGSVDGDVTYRVLVQRVGDSVVSVTALPIDDVESTIGRLMLVEIFGSLAILAALGLVSWWVVHLGIRPVKEMTETASRIAEGDLTVRVPESAPGTESGQLAVALNQMLGTIEGALDERARSEDRLRQFVADASHELRTPVTTIRGYAELYRHGGLADTSMLDDAMRRTEAEAARMGRLVEDMLALAKLDEERPLARAQVDLAALVRDAGADAVASAPGRPISVDVDPALAAGAHVVGDEDRIRQVLGNVVANALVHTDPDVPVTLRLLGDGDALTIEVTDAGQGMPPEVAARITERFYRADPARTRHRGGSGLGMSIVDAAIRAHGGSVAVDSAPGAGTTVRLSIPRG